MLDTIFALSSGSLPSGVAVIRLSGPHVRFGLETICGHIPEPRNMRLVAFRDSSGALVDRGLCVYFPAPSSFTGEDCAEFHLHGSRAGVRKCLDVLVSLSGFRAAEAGEFSKRAFLNGKMDLTEAEGLADLILAETETQRKLALLLSEGGLKDLYSEWRFELIRVRSMLEAAIEFSDEDDVSDRALASFDAEIDSLITSIESHVRDARSGEIIQDGFQVAIVGAPNAGKSSLLNVLAKRDVAIAADEAGTTRDIIEVRLNLNGHLVVLADTAGIRETDGKVERIGIERARERSRNADLVIALYDAVNPIEFELDIGIGEVFRVGGHADLVVGDLREDYDFLVSSLTGEGIPELESAIRQCASVAVGSVGLSPVRDRQLDLLKSAVSRLRSGRSEVKLSPELAAESLRLACDDIGRLTGAIGVEDLLDVVFSSFCIGK